MLAISSGEGGRLAVGAASTAKYFAPRLIAAFIGSQPKLDLRFLIGNRDATMASLRARGRRRAFRTSAARYAGREAFPVGPHPYVLIAPPDIASPAPRVDPAHLAGEPFLFRETGSGTRSLFDYFIGDTRSGGCKWASSSARTRRSSRRSWLGSASRSSRRTPIAAEVDDGRLVTLDVEGLPIVRQWFVLHRADRPLSPAARAFRDFAVEPRIDVPAPGAGPGAGPHERTGRLTLLPVRHAVTNPRRHKAGWRNEGSQKT